MVRVVGIKEKAGAQQSLGDHRAQSAQGLPLRSLIRDYLEVDIF
jgi:hypothetical protein